MIHRISPKCWNCCWMWKNNKLSWKRWIRSVFATFHFYVTSGLAHDSDCNLWPFHWIMFLGIVCHTYSTIIIWKAYSQHLGVAVSKQTRRIPVFQCLFSFVLVMFPTTIGHSWEKINQWKQSTVLKIPTLLMPVVSGRVWVCSQSLNKIGIHDMIDAWLRTIWHQHKCLILYKCMSMWQPVAFSKPLDILCMISCTPIIILVKLDDHRFGLFFGRMFRTNWDRFVWGMPALENIRQNSAFWQPFKLTQLDWLLHEILKRCLCLPAAMHDLDYK